MRRAALCWVLALAVLPVCAWVLAAYAEEAAPPERGEAGGVAGEKVYDPGDTKVAVLPFVNALGKESEEHQKACETATKQLSELFASRRFQVVEESSVSDGIKKLGLDLADSEARTRETFQKIADELGVNLLVCGVLLNYKSDTKTSLLASRKVGHVKIELKVYDSQDKAYRVRLVQAGTSKGSPLFPGLERSRGLREAALEDAIAKALKDFLKPYPVTKKKEKPSR